jgi:CubicO group peptidase (beta-lactamase class C family)
MTLHEAMAARVERGEFPGIVTLIARGDEVRVDAVGTTAVGGDVPMRRDTVFRIASMTKPVLAAAAMILVEDGLIRLDEPIHRLLPELTGQRVLARIDGPLDETVPAARPVTIDDLLTFRMGFGMLTEPTFNPSFPIVETPQALGLVLNEPDPRTPHDPDEWIRRFATLPLMCQPGERWLYNTGTLVLGVLLARAADRPLDALLRERVFEPLGMAETGFWLPAERAAQLPAHYMADSETGELRDLTATTPPEVWSRPPVFPSGSAGLVSTADDFHAFARMLLHRGVHRGTRLLSERSVELMTTNRLTPEQIAASGLLDDQGWGLGLAVTVAPSPPATTPGRYGWSGGYGTDWFNDPHEGLIAIALTQVSDFMWSGAMKEFRELAYE